MRQAAPCAEAFFRRVPASLHARSGKVFYTGTAAFSKPACLYVLGLNPGGHPDNYTEETIEAHTNKVMKSLPPSWSAYRDESWEGRPPGTYGMAPSVLHMFRKLSLRPEDVPSSNLVFIRSRTEADLAGEFHDFAAICWPFHELVIQQLRPRVVLCFGTPASEYVRERLGAHRQIAEFREQNHRGWASRVHVTASGLKVASVTHPSRADWRNPAADPSDLLSSALA